ncbi:MAG: vWA domain-containing protein, partial [Ktedonobacteraceae bacterium]
MGYLDEVKYAQNPEPRCACVLLLDTSYSMDGRPIQELNRGLQTFQEAIQKDDLARKRVEIAIVTFGNGGVQQKQDFVTAEAFEAPNPPLTAGG